MNELIVEGLNENDFVVLEKILKTYQISLTNDVSFEELTNLYIKVKQVLEYLDKNK